MLPSDKLFNDQLKTSDDVHIEQAPIDDDKKGEEAWPAFRQLLKRRRSFCDIEKWVLCTKTTTTFIIVRIAGQVLHLNALSTVAMVPFSIDLGTWMFTKEKNSITILTSKRIDYHQRLFISRRWRYSCTCSKTNWNIWIDHQIVTMVFLLKLIRIVRCHRSMILIFFQSIVFMNNKCTMGSLYE